MPRRALGIVLAASAAVLVAAEPLATPRARSAPAAPACRVASLPPATAARESSLYGHVRSLLRRGQRFELRFDPALWLSGATANRAAQEDGVVAPGEAVPNDYYIRDESRRALTFRVAPGTRATVITLGARGMCSTRIGVAELAQIVRGRNPQRRRLYGPGNRLGFWIRVRTDTARSLDQQYQP